MKKIVLFNHFYNFAKKTFNLIKSFIMENTINKSKELKTSINLLNQKLHFEGIVEGNKPISIDYVPPFGDNLGYTSLELLLLSLSSCLGSSMLLFLRRMQKTIEGFSINSIGIRKEEHPTGFKTIILEINIQSKDITKEDLDKVVKLSEETYCPVWSMLKGNVEIIVEYNISR
jgi:putative redox protein